MKRRNKPWDSSMHQRMKYLLPFIPATFCLLLLATGGVAIADASHHGTPRALYKAARETGPVVVVIDPGHGGHDSGTTSKSQQEKDITLAIGKLLYGKLKATPNIHPVLTRSSDTFVTLRNRVHIAQKYHANLFLSIHVNSYPKNRSVRGGTCYILSQHGATDAKAQQLAQFENSSDRSLAGVEFSGDRTLNAMLTDLYQNSAIDHADDLADSIITAFSRFEPIYHRKPPRANFAVLRDPRSED